MIKQGKFDNTSRYYEPEQADIMTERLVIGITGLGAVPTLGAWNNVNFNPNSLGGSSLINNLAPFFVMSPLSPTGLPTTGFCLTLLNGSMYGQVVNTPFMSPLPAGFTVTTWRYLHTVQAGLASAAYSSQVPLTGVNFNEDLVSFDLDAAAIRFQITNFDLAVPSVSGRYSIIMAFCEL